MSTRFRTLTPRFVPDLIDVEQELFELPQRVRRGTYRARSFCLTLPAGTSDLQQGSADNCRGGGGP